MQQLLRIIVNGYSNLGVVIARFPKRVEVVGLMFIAIAAGLEFGISSYNSEISNSKFAGVYERLQTLAEGERFECNDTQISEGFKCKPGQKGVVVFTELWSDQAVPLFVNPMP